MFRANLRSDIFQYFAMYQEYKYLLLPAMPGSIRNAFILVNVNYSPQFFVPWYDLRSIHSPHGPENESRLRCKSSWNSLDGGSDSRVKHKYVVFLFSSTLRLCNFANSMIETDNSFIISSISTLGSRIIWPDVLSVL